MKTWLIVDFGDVQTCFYLWEGRFNAGIVDDYKKSIRQNGGRVVAVVRPKY